MDKTGVPVIMYHSIGIPNNNWQWRHLTIPYEIFENQLKWLKKKRFHTITLQELYDYMNEGKKIPKKSIVLTFDDGYLDNWVFAYPLLKKYSFNATLYVSPEFADPRNIIRKNLEDVWKNEIKIKELETIGHISWKEMKEMEKQNTMDIQSHTMTHTWYPISNKIIDFRHPDDPYIWMTWNTSPNKKPYLQIDNKELVQLGKPVYEHERAIGVKQYFPDKKLNDFLTTYVELKGGKDFFKTKNWKNELYKNVDKYKKEKKLNDRYETENEYQKRIHYELQKSKEIISKKLNKKVKFLCWPGGSVTKKTLKKAQEIGYISSTAGRDIYKKRKKMKNRYGDDPLRINRIGPVLYWDETEGINSKIKYKNGFYLILSLYQFQEKKIIAPISAVIIKLSSELYKLIYRFSTIINEGD